MDNIDKLVTLVARELNIPKTDILPKSHFFEDFNIDKIALGDLFAVIESQFGIKLPQDSLAKIETFEDLIKLVEENSNEYL